MAPTLSAEDYRSTHNIAISGNNCDFPPCQSFSAAPFPKDMLVACKKFEKPTPIQAQSWPVLAAKRDVVSIAETGSGKTLAFGLPALLHIQNSGKVISRKERGPYVLILSPTRELAMQTADVFDEAGAAVAFKSTCIYGGVEKHPQRRTLKEGVHIVVATPGRLLDLINEGSCSLENVTYLILDEADRMLDLGFEKEIRSLVAMTSPKRQTLLFSATWPQSIQSIAAEFLRDPIQISIGSMDLAASINVTQIVQVCEYEGREQILLGLLRQYHSSRTNRVLVFVLYKKEASRIERFLQQKGWNCVSIHGDKGQAERTQAFNQFKTAQVPLLVATDVAARGLDIPNVEFVINFSFPLTVEDYVHRIGRTGRGGKKGIAHTLFTATDKAHAGELVNVLRETQQEVPESLLKFGTHTKKREHKMYGAHFKDDAEVPMKKSSHIKFD
eukprot:TRINITY_DN14023_c0_g1_i1.p1 TRINITY_DN14023_c0_g1~~TRINITY_DN14023_c0_g1_i1.p1  ORF type:complete len:443 (-),score=102.46 TRINITY_DN14023_c0_g1_i1:48-1376(-)